MCSKYLTVGVGGARKLLSVCEGGAEELLRNAELSEFSFASSSSSKSLCKDLCDVDFHKNSPGAFVMTASHNCATAHSNIAFACA